MNITTILAQFAAKFFSLSTTDNKVYGIKNGEFFEVPPGGDGRILLPAATSFYVAPSGSDVTGDGSIGNPWQTTTHAIDEMYTKYQHTTAATLYLGTGTYAENIVADGFKYPEGAKNITLRSQSGVRADAVLTGTISVLPNFFMSIRELTRTRGDTIFSISDQAAGVVHDIDVNYSASAGSASMFVAQGRITFAGTININATTMGRLVSLSGDLTHATTVINFSGAPVFGNAWYSITGSGEANLNYLTFTGVTPGGSRPSYSVALGNGIVNPPNFKPAGSLAGVWSQGAIIESGSNSNGYYVKYADGTLEVTGEFDMAAQAISTHLDVVKTLAASFVGTYRVTWTPITAVGSGAQGSIGALLYNGVYIAKAASTITFSSYAYRGATDTPTRCEFRAIGRWY